MRTVQVREAGTDILVTAMEILSPVNNRVGGLHTYQEKRKSILCVTSCNQLIPYEVESARMGSP